MMFKLYYAPDNASLILRMALEEAELPYETILLDRATKAQRKPDYLELNPTGLIPTLVTPHGAMAETAACLLWLCDTCGDAGLGPSPDDPERGEFLRWLFYLSNTVHADLIRIFYAKRFVPEETIPVHYTMISKLLLGHMDILETAVQQNSKLFAPPSALSFYLGPLLRWSVLYPFEGEQWLNLSKYPAIEVLILSLETRASVKASAAAEGLGDAPFSDPQLPNPPEGTAT